MLNKSLTISASSCSYSRRFHLSSLLSIIEEISIEDVIRGGLTKDKTLDKGLLWVISRLSLKINKLPSYDERIEVSTYAKSRIHSFFPRYYVIRDTKGSILIEGEAMWTLIDSKTRKPIDPLKNNISIKKNVLPKDISLDDSYLLMKKEGPVIYKEQRKVRLSDLDLNGHMTNTKYADWYMDIHNQDFYEKHEISSFKIAFLRELKLNEDVELELSNYDERTEVLIGKNKDSNTIFEIEVGY